MKLGTTYAAYFDHTLLKPEATLADIHRLCEEALAYRFYGVCVNSSYINEASKILSGSDVLPLAVVGFPLGAMASASKAKETENAIAEGAKEIDMVLPIGRMLDPSQYAYVAHDITQVVKAAANYPVKVILETALLTPDLIYKASRLCIDCGAAFLKTSTGFSTRGASLEDIRILRKAIADAGVQQRVRIKASGGIRSAKDFLAFVEAGVDRVGSSNSVTILKDIEAGQATELQGY